MECGGKRSATPLWPRRNKAVARAKAVSRSACHRTPEWGYGTRLLRDLERRAFLSGIRTLTLETPRRRPLTLEFYRKHGYQETGRGIYGAVETVLFGKILVGQRDA
jgi:hypothetical protein